MSQPPDLLISDDDDDTSHVSTPVLPNLPASPVQPSFLPPPATTSSEPATSTSPLFANAHLRLPIPTPSANLSQTSFTFVDVSKDGTVVDFDDLPSEVTSADISIAREFSCSSFCLTPCPLRRIYHHLSCGVPHSSDALRYEIKSMLHHARLVRNITHSILCTSCVFVDRAFHSFFGHLLHFKKTIFLRASATCMF